MTDWELVVDAMLLAPAALVLVHEWVRHRRWNRGISSAAQSWLIAVIALQALVRVGVRVPVLGNTGYSGADVLRFDLSPDAVFRLFLFALWLGLGTRVFVAIRGQDRPAAATRGPRAANLHSRAGSSPVSRGAWTFMFATWTYGALVVVAGPSLTGWGASAGSVAAGVALSIVSLALATGAPAAVRAVETDPEPTAPLASPRLANEYAVHRHAKCTGYYWLTLAVVMWIALAVSAFLLTPTLPPSLVYALEASAFVIGALGSAFGLRLVAGRSRLRKILDALRAEAATA